MKRVLLLLIAAALTFGGLSLPAYAADTYALGASGDVSVTSVDIQTVRPGDKVRLSIEKNGAPATRADIRSDKIDVKMKAAEGNKVIKSVSIAYASDIAYVEIELVDPFASVKEQDINLSVYLTQNKSTLSGTTVSVYGALENHIQYVDSGDDYVDLEYSPVVEAEDTVRKIEMYLGQGLSIIANLNKNTKYYGYVAQDVTASDYDIVDQHPEIETIYYLTTIGLNGANNRARFDVGDRYYVYNSGLEYIGTTADDLPYSVKYYLSSVELDIDESILPDDDLLDDELNDQLDGDEHTPGVGGKNPDTGTNSYAGLAAFTAMLSLAVAGAAARKRR